MTKLPKDLFSTIRRIQIQTTHLVEDLLAGSYRSAFKGRGMEFEEVREYIPGDDVRSIDWNVTARMGHPYVKSFREERELTVLLVVDISRSTQFGTASQLVSELIAEIGALLAFSAIKNNDRVGLLLFSDNVEQYLSPKKGLRHVLRLVRELVYSEPTKRGTQLAEALAFVGKVHQRRSVCFILSDFICPDFEHELKLLSTKHDIIGLCLTDPSEQQFPALPLSRFRDLETQETVLVDTAFPQTQERIKLWNETRMQELHSVFAKAGAALVEIPTDKPYVPIINRFFKSRGKKK